MANKGWYAIKPKQPTLNVLEETGVKVCLFVFLPYSQRNKLETYLSTYICIFILMLPFCLKVTNENFTVYTSEMKNFKTNFSSGLLSTKGFSLHVT